MTVAECKSAHEKPAVCEGFEWANETPLSECLLNAQTPLALRYEALFAARTLKTPECVQWICDGVLDKDHKTKSVLLRHEACYVLGQIKATASQARMISALEDVSEHYMTRHEAAEALGAFGDESCIAVLEKYATSTDAAITSLPGADSVADTCKLALHSIRTRLSKKADELLCSGMVVIDPVPVVKAEESKELCDFHASADLAAAVDQHVPGASETVQYVRSMVKCMLADDAPLESQYSAMYRLRSKFVEAVSSGNSADAASVLRGLAFALNKVKSSLFKHEMSFVLGQLAGELEGHSASFREEPVMKAAAEVAVAALCTLIDSASDYAMCRHEAAIGLGSWRAFCPAAQAKLDEQAKREVDEDNQEEAVVIESCRVALTF